MDRRDRSLARPGPANSSSELIAAIRQPEAFAALFDFARRYRARATAALRYHPDPLNADPEKIGAIEAKLTQLHLEGKSRAEIEELQGRYEQLRRILTEIMGRCEIALGLLGPDAG